MATLGRKHRQTRARVKEATPRGGLRLVKLPLPRVASDACGRSADCPGPLGCLPERQGLWRRLPHPAPAWIAAPTPVRSSSRSLLRLPSGGVPAFSQTVAVERELWRRAALGCTATEATGSTGHQSTGAPDASNPRRLLPPARCGWLRACSVAACGLTGRRCMGTASSRRNNLSRRHLSPRQELDRGRVCPRLWAGVAVTGCKEHGAPKTVSRKLDCPATSLDRPTYRAPRKAGW